MPPVALCDYAEPACSRAVRGSSVDHDVWVFCPQSASLRRLGPQPERRTSPVHDDPRARRRVGNDDAQSRMWFFPSVTRLSSISSRAASFGLVARMPLDVDLCLHAVPFLSLLVDFIVFENKFAYEQANTVALIVISAYGICYGAWVEHIAKFNKMFPYPFLTVRQPFSVHARTYVLAILVRMGFFRIVNDLHH
ncbi:hypothetical protein HYDPIDRAFT_164692 [Hydnomerulius pinastri MD-312]|nr:hypothetical protein HYDPIDRAFT_164692 [Hydnomerulius pinastri MD-312]